MLSIFKNLSGNKKKAISNVIWATIGKVARILTEFIVGIFVARYLGPEQFGLMNYVISYVIIFNIIAEFGLSNIEIRELAKCPEERDVLLGSSFTARIILSTITYILILVSVLLSNADVETSTLILIYGSTIFFTAFELIRNYFTSIVKNKYVVITGIIRNIIGALVKVVLLFVDAPLIFFICALVFDGLIIVGGYITSYKHEIGKFTWRYDFSIAKSLLKEAFPLLLSGAAVVIYQRIDQVIIKSMLDNSAVGYFSVATKFADFLLFIPMIMAQTISPILVVAKENSYEDYRQKAQYYVDVVTWISIFLSVFTSIFSFYLVRYTFGSEYISAIPVLQILSFKAILSALQNSSGQLIIVDGKQKWAVLRNVFGLVMCVVGNYILIPRYGIVGSAWATLITLSFTGVFGNLIIKPFREYFFMQVKSICFGWKSITKLLKNR
ncbi:flippase [Odoribacter laneus]